VKKPWVLFLEPGHVMETGWEGEVRSFIAKGESRAAAFRMRSGGYGMRPMLREVIALLRFRLLGRLQKGRALLVPAKLLDKTGRFASALGDDEAELMHLTGRAGVYRLKAAVFASAAHPA
jgi:hypothetical protein